MAFKLILTVTKPYDTSPWILAAEEYYSLYTQEELDNIVKPYLESIRTYPGLISRNFTVLNDVCIRYETIFSTREQLDNYNNFLQSNAFQTLRNSKLAALNLSYITAKNILEI